MKSLKRLFALALIVCVTFGLAAEEKKKTKSTGFKGKFENAHLFINDLNNLQQRLKMPLPFMYSWKAMGGVTPSKDQGDYTTCWVFASVGAMEAKIKIFYGEETDLSESYMLCCFKNNGCSCWNKGTIGALKFFEEYKPVKESCQPYQCVNTTAMGCDEIKKKCPTLPYQGYGFYTLDMTTGPKEVIKDLKLTTFLDGPPIVAMFLGSDFFKWWYSSKTPKNSVYLPIDNKMGHIVIIIGWNNMKKAFLCKNSMGKDSGPNGDGTFWLAYPGTGREGKEPFSYASFEAANIKVKKVK